MEIFLDADLILEMLLNRSGLVEDVEDIFEILQGKQVQGFISELGLEKIHSIVKRLGNPEAGEILISGIEEIIEIIPINSTLLQKARSLSLVDFESAVEITCATQMNIGVIVTHNSQCFAGSALPTLQVCDLWKRQYLERILQKDVSPVLLVGELLDIQRLEKLLEKSSECLRDLEISREDSNENKQLSDIRQNFDAQFKSLLHSENPENRLIVNFIKRYLRMFNPNTCEVSSILNEVYLYGVSYIERGKIINNPKAWIRITALNIIRANSRRNKKFNPLQVELIPSPNIGLALEEDFGSLEKQALAISLKQLRPEERLILHLRYFEDLSWSKVGERLACEKGEIYNVDCLRKRVSRVIKRLRKIYSTVLNELYFGDDSNYSY